MKKNRKLYLIGVFFIYFFCACNSKNVDLQIIKIYTNYPENKVEWYHAPPEMEIIFLIKNNSDKHLAIPMKGEVSSSSLECSNKKLSLEKARSKEIIYSSFGS